MAQEFLDGDFGLFQYVGQGGALHWLVCGDDDLQSLVRHVFLQAYVAPALSDNNLPTRWKTRTIRSKLSDGTFVID